MLSRVCEAHVLLHLAALLAVEGVRDALPPANDTSALEGAVVALVTDAHQSVGPYVAVADGALAITAFAKSTYGCAQTKHTHQTDNTDACEATRLHACMQATKRGAPGSTGAPQAVCSKAIHRRLTDARLLPAHNQVGVCKHSSSSSNRSNSSSSSMSQATATSCSG